MRKLFVILGSFSLALGVIGIFLPLLPTTPFLLLSAWFYLKGSDKLYGWIMAHPTLGLYIRNYRDKKAITRQSKLVSVALLWITILISIFFVAEAWWLRVGLGVILLAVSWHILSFRTMKREENMRLIKVRKEAHLNKVAALTREEYRERQIRFANQEGEKLREPLPKYNTKQIRTRHKNSDPINGEIKKQLSTQIEKGYTHYMLHAGGREIGYATFRVDSDRLILCKFYLLKGARGKGYAREALTFLNYYCKRHGIKVIRLMVRKNDARHLAALLRSGFLLIGNEEQSARSAEGSYIVEKHIHTEQKTTPN